MSIPYAVLDVPHLALTRLDDIVKTTLLSDRLDILLFLLHPMVVKEGHDITMPHDPRTKSPSRFFPLPSHEQLCSFSTQVNPRPGVKEWNGKEIFYLPMLWKANKLIPRDNGIYNGLRGAKEQV